jgi:hypothetical protein
MNGFTTADAQFADQLGLLSATEACSPEFITTHFPTLSQVKSIDDIEAAFVANPATVATEAAKLWVFAGKSIDTIKDAEKKNASLLSDGYEDNKFLSSEVTRLKCLVLEVQAEKATLASMGTGGAYRAQRSAEHPDPDKFDGESPKLLRGFLTDMGIKLRVNSDWYPSEQDRMAYFLSRLKGKAKGQTKGGTTIRGDITFKGVDEIITILDSAFGDINEKASSQGSLFNMLQGNKTLASFLPDWQETASTSAFGDEALIALLKRALHPDIIGRLSYIPIADHKTIINEFVAQVRGIDNVLRNIDPNYHKKRQGAPAAIPNVTLNHQHQASGLTTTDGGTAMDLSVMELGPAVVWSAKDVSSKRIPKTLNEREAKKTYCHANGLCVWCLLKHPSTDCPTAPWNRKNGSEGKA